MMILHYCFEWWIVRNTYRQKMILHEVTRVMTTLEYCVIKSFKESFDTCVQTRTSDLRIVHQTKSIHVADTLWDWTGALSHETVPLDLAEEHRHVCSHVRWDCYSSIMHKMSIESAQMEKAPNRKHWTTEIHNRKLLLVKDALLIKTET